LAFLDEQQQEVVVPEEPERPRRRVGGPQRRRQQFLVRRLIGVGVGLGFLILVVIGIRGCLQARENRALRNYAQDVGTIMQESEQRGSDFFGIISNPSGSGSQSASTQVLADRDASQSLLDRAQKISVPGQMGDAQAAVEQTLTLRRNGLSTIAASIPQATAQRETSSAISHITDAMGALYAGDVIWTQIGSPDIKKVLHDANVDAPALPEGKFMPANATDFLDQTSLVSKLSGIVGSSATSGSHGLGLIQTSIGDTTLSADSTTNVSSSATELAVQVQNQGSADESAVQVTVTLNGSSLEGTIPTLSAGSVQSVRIPLTTKPQPGTDTQVEVLVHPVTGEQVTSNNQATYTVVFGTSSG
jgi:CARDB protein